MKFCPLRAASDHGALLARGSGGEQYELGKKVRNQKKKYRCNPGKYNPDRKTALETVGVVFTGPAKSFPERAAQVSACVAGAVLPSFCCLGDA